MVTPVQNQGSCESCWTFSTTGTIESARAITTGTLQMLSKQQLLDCVSNTGGCAVGGYATTALVYATTNTLIPDADYPYTEE